MSSAEQEERAIFDWRLRTLLELEFPYVDARLLAELAHVDVHQAAELIAAGCPHDTARRILE